MALFKITVDGSPTIKYEVEANIVARAATTASVSLKITSKLGSSQSKFLDGYILKAYIDTGYCDEQTIILKDADDLWRGTTSHTVTKNFKLTGLSSTSKKVDIKFKVNREDNLGVSGDTGDYRTTSLVIGQYSTSEDGGDDGDDETVKLNYTKTYNNPVVGSIRSVYLYRPSGKKASIDLKIGGKIYHTWKDLYSTIQDLGFGASRLDGVFNSSNNKKTEVAAQLVTHTDGQTETTEEDIVITLDDYAAAPSAPTLSIIEKGPDTVTIKAVMPSGGYKFGATHSHWEVSFTHPTVSGSWVNNTCAIVRTEPNMDDCYAIVRAVDSRGIKGARSKILCFPGNDSGVVVKGETGWEGITF